MKYNLILSDPAWKQSKGGKKNVRKKTSGINLDYNTLSIDEIKNIHLQLIEKSEKNHVCFLWAIDKYLPQAEKMMLDLGYKLHARMIWNKVTGIPAAFTVRYGHEYLLFFYFGKLLPVEKKMRGKIHTVFTEKVLSHSRKPEISYLIIEALYPKAKKIELFCRYKRKYWHAWGNEIESDIKVDGFLVKKGNKIADYSFSEGTLFENL